MSDQQNPEAASEPAIEVRSCARLVLLDETGRVLLFLHQDGHSRQFWATPGGGVEPGESADQAAHREAAEELGAQNVELLPFWEGHSEFRFADRRVSQDETFFPVIRHSGILGPDVAAVHRDEGIVEVRWWSLDEIESAGDAVVPRNPAARLKVHLRDKNA